MNRPTDIPIFTTAVLAWLKGQMVQQNTNITSVQQLDVLLYIDEHRAESCLYTPVLEARFTEVLSVLARRKGGIIR